MSHEAKEHISLALGHAVTWLAVIGSWQEQLEWGLRIFVLLIGALSGLLTLRAMLKRRRARALDE